MSNNQLTVKTAVHPTGDNIEQQLLPHKLVQLSRISVNQVNVTLLLSMKDNNK